jgi:[ribosomal protein S5]-alanine N-acetyltransferase
MNNSTDGTRHHFDSVPVLKSGRLVLRAIDPADAAAIVEITTYDGVPARSEAEAREYLERIHMDFARGETLHWGICDRGSQEIIGTCGFYRGFQDNTGEIGYILRNAHRGRGVMTEAVRLVVEFGFGAMKLSRIIAITDPENSSSIAVLERAGFERLDVEPGEARFEVSARP